MNTYHITFGTYGTRLHGGVAPTVALPQNHYGEEFIKTDSDLWAMKRAKMNEIPCVLSLEQRLFAEEEILPICERGKWNHHISAVQEDHVHVLLSAEADSKAVRKWLKTWLTQSLNDRFNR